MREIRAIKSDFELNQIRESAKIHAESILKSPLYTDPEWPISIFRSNWNTLWEKQVRWNFSFFRRKHGHFYGSILTGNNAQTPSPYDYALGEAHFPTTATGCKRNTTKKWHYSHGRYGRELSTLHGRHDPHFCIGKVPEIAIMHIRVSIDIHNKIWETAKPGTLCSDLYYLQKKDERNQLEPYFMEPFNRQNSSARVGLEINEPPYWHCARKKPFSRVWQLLSNPNSSFPVSGRWDRKHLYCQRKRIGKITLFEEALTTLWKFPTTLHANWFQTLFISQF